MNFLYTILHRLKYIYIFCYSDSTQVFAISFTLTGGTSSLAISRYLISCLRITFKN